MNDHLRERILRRLEALNDERGYQVLDYVEFLESKFAERQNPQSNTFTRFTEAVEDRLRAGKVSASASRRPDVCPFAGGISTGGLP